MKTNIYTLFFLLISSFFIQAKSQSIMLGAVSSNEQKVTHIKAFESRYFMGKVYLHITVNGNTENNILLVERSLDAAHFEVIGFIRVYGTPVQCDLAYYFTDESPVVANLYYRLSYFNNEQEHSNTISVIPIDNNNAPSLITSVILSAVNK